MLYCFGDSLTRGRPGAAYIKYLKQKERLENHGRGGDTLIGMSRRLERVIRQRKTGGDTLIVGIGVNDLLIPWFSRCSGFTWRAYAEWKIRRGSVPCENSGEFMRRYEAMIRNAAGSFACVLAFGLPMIECSEITLDRQCEDINNGIRQICMRYRVAFIDIREWQTAKKKELNLSGSYFPAARDKTALSVPADAVFTAFPPFTDTLSRKRGLAVTMDGLHFNSVSARGLAGLLDARLGERTV